MSSAVNILRVLERSDFLNRYSCGLGLIVLFLFLVLVLKFVVFVASLLFVIIFSEKIALSRESSV